MGMKNVKEYVKFECILVNFPRTTYLLDTKIKELSINEPK